MAARKLIRASGLQVEVHDTDGKKRVVVLLPLDSGGTAALALSKADDVAEVLRVINVAGAAAWPDDLRFNELLDAGEGDAGDE